MSIGIGVCDREGVELIAQLIGVSFGLWIGSS